MTTEAFDIDADHLNADWPKKTWDIRIPSRVVKTLDQLVFALDPDGLRDRAEVIAEFLKMPAAEYMPKELRAEIEAVKKFDPSQERDESGKWSGTGGGGLFNSPTHEDATAHYGGWAQKLSPPQTDALFWYKAAAHDEVNGVLRGTRGPSASGSEGDYLHGISQNDYVKNIDAAIAKAPGLAEDTIVWRHVSPAALKGIKNGTLFVDKGFVSTTLDSTFARSHAKVSGHSVMEIRIPKGTHAAYMEVPPIKTPQPNTSGATNEHELLLPRGGSFFVTRKDKNSLVANYAPPGEKVVRKYDESQPRAEDGKWTDGGGGGGAGSDAGGSGGAGAAHAEPVNPLFPHAHSKAITEVAGSNNGRKGGDGKPWSEGQIRQELAHAQRTLESTPSTSDEFRNASGEQQAARLVQRQTWLNDAYGSGSKPAPGQPPQAFIYMGPSGAGKSYAQNKDAVDFARAGGKPPLLIDADEFKAKMPEYNNGLGANATHEESVALKNALLYRAVDNGDNIAIAVVGKTYSNPDPSDPGLKEQIEALHAKGYQVHVRLTNVSPQTALVRTTRRFVATGRYVKPSYVFNGVDSKPEGAYVRLVRENKALLASHAAINNEGAPGQERPYFPENGEKVG